MKTLIIALNSKYIHSSLAAWYLKSSCGDEAGEIKIMEFTINDSLDSILAKIYREKADNAAFSCYIWNMELVSKLARSLRAVQPDIKLILGGPEVSFDAEQLMNEYQWADYIISGEGELTLKHLLGHLYDKSVNITEIDGLSRREGDEVHSNRACRLIEDLDSIPSPYTDEMISSLGSRIAYFESSRGCPFSCSYCISSTFEGVRYFSMERVKKELQKLIDARVRQVKFVDRTFNCNRERAKEIIRFVIEKGGETGFHFEAAADLFDDEMLEILAGAPEGLIQLEIGVQTTNTETLELINRKTSLEKVFYNVNRLKAPGNIHLHLDLIAGLPGEDFTSFKKSFDDVYRLKPDQLQLGFLKLLKGSKIRREADLHGCSFRHYPPYEILDSRYISFDELLELKGIEELVERYYNSGRFSKTLEYLIKVFYSSPFEFYMEFYLYNKRNGYLERPLPGREHYTILVNFAGERLEAETARLVNDLLKLDFLASDNSNNLPVGIVRDVSKNFNELCFEFLKNEANIEKYLPRFKGTASKQIFKQVHFESFNYDVTQKESANGLRKEKTLVLFDYSRKNRVTGLYEYRKIDISGF